MALIWRENFLSANLLIFLAGFPQEYFLIFFLMEKKMLRLALKWHASYLKSSSAFITN